MSLCVKICLCWCVILHVCMFLSENIFAKKNVPYDAGATCQASTHLHGHSSYDSSQDQL